MSKIRDETLKKLNNTLHFVLKNRYSSFYRRKYGKAGIKSLKNLNSWEDFKKLPFLRREEIVKTDPYLRLFCPLKKVYRVQFSSGTTGGKYPLVSLMDDHPFYRKVLQEKPLKLEVKAMMILRSVYMGAGRVSLYSHKKYLTVLGDVNNLEVSARIASALKVDGIHTSPSILYFFIPYLEKEYNLLRIKYINLGGEYCSDQKVAFLRRKFKNAYISFTFGGAESENRGYRCEYLDQLPPRYFHPAPTFYYEIHNPEEESELVITHLSPHACFPLIRYKTGDSIKLSQQDCPCGQSRIMEVFGKYGYDLLMIHGAYLYTQQIENAILPYQKYLDNMKWTMHVFERVNHQKILVKFKLQVVPKSSRSVVSLRPTLEKGISDRLYLSAKKTLSDLVKEGYFLPLEVEFVDDFPFEPKQKRIISHLH